MNRIHLKAETFVRLESPNAIVAGRIHHCARQQIHRHRHDAGFLAIVLEGRYVEAGDTGQHLVGPGDVICHRRWENHLNEVGPSGASVLVLPVDNGWAGGVRGVVADPEAIAKLAERDTRAALYLVRQTIVDRAVVDLDWPALLATRLRRHPDTDLKAWANEMGLHPGSLSRGFRQVFGTTPAAYRLAQKTRRALALIEDRSLKFATVAADSGFADQPHMVRSVRQATGFLPSALRRLTSATL